MIYLKGIIIWIIIIFAETIHGIARTLLLEPLTGDFTARQISVFTGAAMILLIATLLEPWLGATKTHQLIGVGFIWLSLTVGFELILGRLVLNYSWERIASDYNLLQGGLLPIGLLILTLSPLIATKLRMRLYKTSIRNNFFDHL